MQLRAVETRRDRIREPRVEDRGRGEEGELEGEERVKAHVDPVPLLGIVVPLVEDELEEEAVHEGVKQHLARDHAQTNH